MALKSQVKTNFCAIEVRKEKYPESNSKDAMEKGNVATTQLGKGNKNKLAIFRYNAGKAKKILPPNHPYRATRCTGNGKIDMTGLMGYPAVFLSAESEKCKANKLIERMDKERISKVLKTQRSEIKSWAKENLLSKHATNKGVNDKVSFTMTGIKEALNQPHKYAIAKNKLIYDIQENIEKSEFIKREKSSKREDIEYSYLKFEEDFYIVIKHDLNMKTTDFYSIVDAIK